jgi:hypothetical protein
MEVSSLQAVKPARVFKARCRAGGAPSRAESGELESQRLRAHPRSKRSPRPWRVHSPNRLPGPVRTGRGWQRTENSNLTACAAARFPAGASRLAGSSSMAEGGRLERHGVTRAPLSGRARRPGRFTFHEYRTADSNRKPPGSGPGASCHVGLVRLASDRPDSNRPCELGELAC